MSPFDDSFINSSSQETYDDIPSGDFGPLSNIGLAKTSRGWRVYINADTQQNGEYPNLPELLTKGFYFLPGDKAKAEQFVKHYLGQEWVSQHMVTAMPVASIINMSDDARAKFTSGFISADVRVSGLRKDYASPDAKHGQGLNLIVIPSIVDAYARAAGVYTETLFKVPSMLVPSKNEAGIENVVADLPPELFETLAEQRKAIWAAYGEKPANWRTNKVTDLTSKTLIRAIDLLVNRPWESWVRMTTVYDPSPKAYYSKTDDDPDSPGHRSRAQVILEFFANEKEATAVGLAELAQQQSVGESTPSNGTSNVSIFNQLSENARNMYGDAATFESVLGDVKEALKGWDENSPEAVRKAKLANMQNTFGLNESDVALVRGA